MHEWDNHFNYISVIYICLSVITNTKLNSGRLNSYPLNLGINKGSLSPYLFYTNGILASVNEHYKEVKSIKIRRSKTIYFDVMIGYVQNPNKLPKHRINK